MSINVNNHTTLRLQYCLITLLFIYGIFGNNFYVSGATIRVGIAKTTITPDAPIYLTGYAGREKPATGVLHELWAKALVIEESEKNKVFIVTTDLLGLSHEVSEAITNSVVEKYHINRSQLLLNSSHTHSGPMVWPSLSVIGEYTAAEQQVVSGYSLELIKRIEAVIDAAYANRLSMNMFCSKDTTNFAKNRRLPTEKGIINAVNLNGPVDHDVPVIKFSSPDGVLKAVLFGYACHNTTMVGDNYLVNGDYAGFAQLEIEKQFPNCTAMFVMGCAGDQNPVPRGNVTLAIQHGKSLANAVFRALDKKMTAIDPTIICAREETLLPFKPVNIKSFEKDLIGSNKFLQRRAKLIVEAYNKGWRFDQYPYAVQGVKLGNQLTILALYGEVVVDYALRAKKEYPKQNLMMAAYSNEVMCYIPSKRVLKEGGYEAVDNMIYYGMPGPFDDSIEERIFKSIHGVINKLAKRK